MDERSIVRSDVNVLEGYTGYSDAARAIRLICIPESMKNLEERLLQEEAITGHHTPTLNMEGHGL